MESEIDRAAIIVRMEIGLNNGHSKIGDVELVLVNDGVDKMCKLFHREVCKMGAKYFLKLSFATVENSLGNSMVIITQQTLTIHPLFGFT